jgi:glycosyltransferase involved in cell wall biosynthesis
MTKILLISNHDPLATGYGAGQRTHLIWSVLRTIGQTDVAWLINDTRDYVERYEVENSRFSKIATRAKYFSDYWWNGYYSPRIARSFSSAFDTSDYDVIVSRYIIPARKLGIQIAKRLVIDFDDPVYRFPKSTLTHPRSLAKELLRLMDQWVTSRQIRSRPLGSADYLFVNSRDRACFPYLKGIVLPNIPCLSSPMAMRLENRRPDQVVLFVGLMTYRPNIEAVDFFLTKIWPDVLSRCPEAIFRIVGKVAAKDELRWGTHPRCSVEGFVEDISEVYATANLAVSPILSGGGSNIKIPEACAYGCPVVATAYSYLGWSDFYQRDIDILVAETAEEFSQKVSMLFNYPDIAARHALDARRTTSDRLSAAAFAKKLVNYLHPVIDSGSPEQEARQR